MRSQPAEGKKAKKKQVDVAENGGTKDGGVAEKEFNTETARCVLRVLGVKKTEGAGDRVIKFLGMFLKAASDKGKFVPFRDSDRC